jgi:hypothetical protein
LELLAKIRQEEAKERLVESAFIGFQMGAGGEKGFGEYLESLGLRDKTIESKPEQTISAKDLATLKRLSQEKLR